jgi:hypothetical protein
MTFRLRGSGPTYNWSTEAWHALLVTAKVKSNELWDETSQYCAKLPPSSHHLIGFKGHAQG